MPGDVVHISSLDRVAERVLDHLRLGHHTTLVGSPGCGTTTFVTDLSAEIVNCGFRTNRFDGRNKLLKDFCAELTAERQQGAPRQILVLDHVTTLSKDDFARLLASTREADVKNRDLCLWCGNVDARSANDEYGLKIYSVPSAHISFPVLNRDELLSAYRTISSQHGCRWGEAILYLMLDLCGSDLGLVASITDYLHGDWSDRLYDDSVWDRIQDWLNECDQVDLYRSRLTELKEQCADTLALLRFGGKPPCKAELFDEKDDGLRKLCLNGFLIPNLLPGFYQLRNMAVRFLLDESILPEVHFLRATNERAGALLQDTETMLRQVLVAVFKVIGREAAKAQLEKMQQPGDVIEEKLNAAILRWSREKNSEDAHRSLTSLITEHRNAFRAGNSAWTGTLKMMERDGIPDGDSSHINAIDYLTFDQLGTLAMALMEHAMPRLRKDLDRKRVRDRWLEAIAKVRRLRNQVAHLRNVGFQDMEDLARTLDGMRRDVIDYGAWKEPSRPANEVAQETVQQAGPPAA
jgi:hypothetical protein